MKQNLITVKATPISIAVNFEESEEYLKCELKKYDVIVTQDTLKGCKKLSTDLNKVAAEIDAKRKAELATMTAPIKEFDAKMKSLITLCKDGREKITKQVKVFEDKTRLEVEKLLTDQRAEFWRTFKVKEKFLSAEFDDLIVLSSMTAKGNLTKKAWDALEDRCAADKNRQTEIENRLLKLENASYKAGLAAPLEEVHVRAFLYRDEEVYESELKLLLDAEVKRQAAAKEKIEKETTERVQREAATQAVETPSSIAETESKPEPVEAKVEEKIEKPVATEGNTFHVIQARFEVSVPSHIPVDRVVAKLKKVMEEAGITSLKEIKVVA